LQIESGLLGDEEGRPVAVRVFDGNTSDSRSFLEAISTVRDQFGLTNLTIVGDRNDHAGPDRRPQGPARHGLDHRPTGAAIAALAADDGPLQMSLFDTQNFAQITDLRYPGERLVCCRNPALADERGRKREALLAATEQNLDKLVASVNADRLHGADQIGVKLGKSSTSTRSVNTSSQPSPTKPSATAATKTRSPRRPHSMGST
jgi:hypothetical protein